MENNHIIKTTKIDFSINGYMEEDKVIQSFELLTKNRILPDLNLLMDTYSSSEQYIRLDKLSLDLGEIDVRDFENELLKKLTQIGGDALSQIKKDLATAVDSTERKEAILAEDTPKSPYEFSENAKLAETEIAWKTFLSFIKNGQLSWKDYHTNLIKQENQLEKIFQEQKGKREAIIELLGHDLIRHRIIRQYSDTLLKDLQKNILHAFTINNKLNKEIRELFVDIQSALRVVIFVKKTKQISSELLKISDAEKTTHPYKATKALTSSKLEIERKEKYWNLLLQLPKVFSNHLEKPELQIEKCLELIASKLNTDEFNTFKNSLSKPLSNRIDQSKPDKIADDAGIADLLIPEQQQEENEEKRLVKELVKLLKKTPQSVFKTKNTQTKKLQLKATSKRTTDTLSKAKTHKKELEQILEEGIYIENAGLVILQPFFKTLFDRLGWIEDDHFFSFFEQQQAIHLLQFLATGQTQCFEFELTLNKLLCGIDIDEPVHRDIDLSEDLKAHADDLLKAVIKNWPALKNTSPDGLRSTFLTRPGKLQKTSEEKYLLQVETKAQDLLLTRLPWTISVVRQPWMQNLIIVEWQ